LKTGTPPRGAGRGRPLATTLVCGKPGDLAAGFKDAETRAQVKPSGTTAIATQGWVNKKILEGDIEGGMASAQSGTSIFDPVICELAYRWFTPVGGNVLDPFAGGSVRGILASLLGRQYTGIDLRPEQAQANEEQGKTICKANYPKWLVGDSQNIQSLAQGEYDFIFSCPPYADLERYSDDPRDLSTMEYADFLTIYRKIIAESCAMLKEDRFACFVVGDVRDRQTGNYRNFPADTIQAFRDAGLELYNDAILVTAVGSLPIRVGKQFASSRKLGKTHQNVLVFIKGDAARASEACGTVDLADLAMPSDVANQTVALALSDLAEIGFEGFTEDIVVSEGDDTCTIDRDPTEAALVCDILRYKARAANKTLRTWIVDDGMWNAVANDVDLTYIASEQAYLNHDVFVGCARPQSIAREAVAMTFGRKM
jgi:DNA modification methylase